MMLGCVKACMELDSPSFTNPAFVLTENFSSILSPNLRKAREALIELLGNENMFRQSVQLPYKYRVGMKPVLSYSFLMQIYNPQNNKVILNLHRVQMIERLNSLKIQAFNKMSFTGEF